MPKIISDYIELHICRYSGREWLFLLLKRSPKIKVHPGIWQMITGSVEKDEFAPDAAFRELLEETGIVPLKMLSIPRVNTFYLELNDSVCLSPVFLAVTDKEDVLISVEHTEHKWLNYEEAVKLIHWPDQIESLNLIYKYLNDDVLFSKLPEVKKNSGE
jgi:8-oxo-dGTP pyrophosphatase MutT (NUDIX family)